MVFGVGVEIAKLLVESVVGPKHAADLIDHVAQIDIGRGSLGRDEVGDRAAVGGDPDRFAGLDAAQDGYHCVSSRVERMLNDVGKPVRGSKIALLGVSYKPGSATCASRRA